MVIKNTNVKKAPTVLHKNVQYFAILFPIISTLKLDLHLFDNLIFTSIGSPFYMVSIHLCIKSNMSNFLRFTK